MRSNTITLLVCVASSVATAFGVNWFLNRDIRKTAVVDAVRLFNSFRMKTELEQKARMQLEYLGRQTDSLKQAYQMAVKTGQSDADLKALAAACQYAAGSLDEAYRRSNEQINEEVWKRLNPLIDEYGKQQGWHLIIGANGMGSVLYNDSYYDKTNQVIDYVNNRYEKGN